MFKGRRLSALPAHLRSSQKKTAETKGVGNKSQDIQFFRNTRHLRVSPSADLKKSHPSSIPFCLVQNLVFQKGT